MAEHRIVEGPAGSNCISPPPAGPLRLRVIGTARHGQVIEIAAPRLTIGSGPDCTLRLRAAGVGPLQCLIVREPGGPVVRSLSAETLLNGQEFREEVLRIGDRLRIGSIELELCDDGRPSEVAAECPVVPQTSPQSTEAVDVVPNPVPEPAAIDLVNRLERLEQFFEQLRAADSATETEPHDEPVAEPSLDLAAANALLAKEVDESAAALQRQAEELRNVQAEVVRANERFERVQAELVKLDQELIAFRAHCKEQLSESLRERTDLEQALAVERELRSDLGRKLDEQSVRVADLEFQCSSLQAEMLSKAREQQAIVAPPNPIAVAVEQSPAPAVNVTEPEAAPVPTNISRQRRHEMAWLAEQFASASVSFADEPSVPDLKPAELNLAAESDAAVVMAEVSVVDDFQTRSSNVPVSPCEAESPATLAVKTQPEPESVREPVFEQIEINCEELDEPGEELDEPGESSGDVDVVAESASLSPREDAGPIAGRDDVCEESSNIPCVVVEQSGAPQCDAAPDECEFRADVDMLSQSRSDKADDPPATADDQMNDAESVIARLSQAGIWKNNDDDSKGNSLVRNDADRAESTHAAPNEPEESGDDSSSQREPSWKHASTGNSSGDDSIELYMERLLQRVRGECGERMAAEAHPASEADRSPRTEADLSLDEPAAPLEPVLLTESEYLPRRQAPELTASMEAMRAIGNDNRKKHILRHAQQTWAAKSHTKLIGSVIGLAVAFASFFYLDTHTEFAAAGLFAGFGVAGFWIWQALHFRKQLFDSLRLNTESNNQAPKTPENQNPRAARTS